jgi:hypothetical protein
MKSVKIFSIFIILAIVFGGVMSPAKAQAFSYTSGFQVQNLENTEASIHIIYYDQAGSIVNEVDDVIAASDSNTYFPIEAPEGFNGSVVIQSNVVVASVVNILGDNGLAAASYVGSGEPSLELLLPLLMQDNSGYNTWFNVQNAGSATANVEVAYSDGTTANASIPVGAAHTFNQATETHSLKVFSAIVTSDQPIAAAVIEESSDVMFAYSGFASGTTNPVMPLVNANNSGYVTGIQIQNGGNVASSVTVSYTPSAAGTACTETQSIDPGASKTFALLAFNDGSFGDCVGGALFVGSATVTGNTAGVPLVGITNQLLPGVNGEAYGSFDATVATDAVVMPLIMDRNSGYFTGFNVMNVGAGSTSVSCVFTNNAYTVNGTLDPGEALTDLQVNKLADGYVGSATCTAGAGGAIVGVVNELGPSGTADQLLVYEAISR